ncbi:hypothetical protein [Cellulomonas pakistanensis]|uniref:Lipoprotein n=1 Tax=Cellulomonas pakistanensis TaxID=992287 RepID=A0A919P9G8_9CELL|nr:hypothetical protein [Cellulomonas pakistanensis]GIG35416.1 hypothetical protein Cpa01nite_07970 [Cellulomonas pakistanensis]
MARSRTSARPVVVGAALALAAALSGCSVTNQITTELAYSASDGVRATLGDLTAENLMLVAEAADAPGALQGALTNRGDEPLTVSLALAGESERVRLDAGETVLLGGSEGEEIVFDAPGAPGATVDMTLSTGAAGEQTVPVPVLDGTLPEYRDLVPEEVVVVEEPLPIATASAEDTTEPGTEPGTGATAEPGTEPGADATTGTDSGSTGTEDSEQAGGTEG